MLRPELGWARRELQMHLENAGIFTRVIFSGHAAPADDERRDVPRRF